MTDRILVMGAAGRFGYAAAEAFHAAGWDVTGLVRPGAAARAPRGIRIVETIDRLVAIEAARGMDVVLHALNPPFKTWRRMALPHAYSAIEIAETAGATLMLPGTSMEFRRWHAGRHQRDDADAANDAQGADPSDDRGPHARSLRSRHARDHPACRRLLRRRARLVVRPRASPRTPRAASSPIRGRSMSCTSGPICPTWLRPRCGSPKSAESSTRSRPSAFRAMR